VGVEYCITSCDLGVFVDEAAELIPPENAHIRRGCGWIGTSGARVAGAASGAAGGRCI
jgi:hypothetical protein